MIAWPVECLTDEPERILSEIEQILARIQIITSDVGIESKEEYTAIAHRETIVVGYAAKKGDLDPIGQGAEEVFPIADAQTVHRRFVRG